MDYNFHLFRRVWSASALALLAATWKLWTPQHAFPQVPVLAELGKLPDVIDWIALGGTLLALVTVLVAPARSVLWRQGLVVFVVATALLMAIDQHRFQPWAYQFLIVAVVLATATPRAAFALLRWLTIGIYLWSAWSKCDMTFTHNLGQQFLNSVFSWAGFETWPKLLRLVLASLFPTFEVLVAVLLCFPRWWPKAVWASVVLHLVLLLVLGPFGLQHKPGVLLWNIYFIAQNLILFRAASPVVVRDDELPHDEPIAAAALYVVAGALIWPLVETWNYCDHWPAWSVYAPRVERTSFFVHRSEKDRLPAELQTFLEQATDDENWYLVRLDRWSLELLDTPLYPQNRFQVAGAAGVIHQFGLIRFRIVWFGTADRWTGKRVSNTLASLNELEAAAKAYVLGCRTVRPLVFTPDKTKTEASETGNSAS